MGDDDEIQRNRSFFRTVNARLLEADPAAEPRGGWRFFCECGAGGCHVQLDVARDEMARFSGVAGWRVVAAGHAAATDEVVERGAGYLVVAGCAA